MILMLAHATDPRWIVTPGSTPPETILSEELFGNLPSYDYLLTVKPGEPDAVYLADAEGTWRIAAPGEETILTEADSAGHCVHRGAAKLCPECGEAMTYDAGYPSGRWEPEQPPAWFCECGHEETPDE